MIFAAALVPRIGLAIGHLTFYLVCDKNAPKVAISRPTQCLENALENGLFRILKLYDLLPCVWWMDVITSYCINIFSCTDQRHRPTIKYLCILLLTSFLLFAVFGYLCKCLSISSHSKHIKYTQCAPQAKMLRVTDSICLSK